MVPVSVILLDISSLYSCSSDVSSILLLQFMEFEIKLKLIMLFIFFMYKSSDYCFRLVALLLLP